VENQQEQIDEVEDHMEQANVNAQSALKQIEIANANASKASQCAIS